MKFFQTFLTFIIVSAILLFVRTKQSQDTGKLKKTPKKPFYDDNIKDNIDKKKSDSNPPDEYYDLPPNDTSGNNKKGKEDAGPKNIEISHKKINQSTTEKIPSIYGNDDKNKDTDDNDKNLLRHNLIIPVSIDEIVTYECHIDFNAK